MACLQQPGAADGKAHVAGLGGYGGIDGQVYRGEGSPVGGQCDGFDIYYAGDFVIGDDLVVDLVAPFGDVSGAFGRVFRFAASAASTAIPAGAVMAIDETVSVFLKSQWNYVDRKLVGVFYCDAPGLYLAAIRMELAFRQTFGYSVTNARRVVPIVFDVDHQVNVVVVFFTCRLDYCFGGIGTL